MIKVTSEAEKVCVAKANEAGQGHIFDGWDELPPEDQRTLISQVMDIDFQLMTRLVGQCLQGSKGALEGRVLKPAPTERLPRLETNRQDYELCRTLGEYAIRNGEVTLVMAAGGGPCPPHCEPAGMLPVGPVSGNSLFQLHAEKIQALNRRYRTSLRWTIVCHPAEQEQVAAFFKSKAYFGLQCTDIGFTSQDLLPVVDRRGKILLSAPGRMAMGPNGHGGVLLRLLDPGRLETLEEAGVRHIFYFQADNPLVSIADPAFLGHHIRQQCEVSSKAVRKEDPAERTGVFCQVNDATGVVEYSELTEADRNKRDADGSLVLAAANVGAHVFSIDFLRRLREERIPLPFHAVERLTPYIRRGKLVRPVEPNSFRFVAFAFDAIWLAKRTSILEVEREDEFSPIKQATGSECSPASAQLSLSRLYARWLREAGAKLPERAGTEHGPAVEISPLFALDAAELKERAELHIPSTGSILLGGRP